MGLFEKLFQKEPKVLPQGTFKLLNGYTPVFTSWGGNIYESELVRAAIDARARHMSKLQVEYIGSAKPSLKSKLKAAPNEWQTWGQFLYRLSTILDVKNTAFIVPVLGQYGETTGIYPIYTDRWELVNFKDQVFIRFYFADQKSAAIELSKVGIMTKYQLKSDLFGETNCALGSTMELINMQEQGISEAVKSAASYRFMAKLTNFSNDLDIKNERERFTRENLEKGNGILLFPNTYSEIKQIESKPYVVDSNQMTLIQKNVYNYFGVNEKILQNAAYGDEWSAFYEGCIEPFAIQFSDVATKMIFSLKERELGSHLMATSNRLQYMSNNDKLNVSAQMADRGLMTRNEIRAIWNLPPLPEEIGDTLPVRGEYYNLDNQNGVIEDGTTN